MKWPMYIVEVSLKSSVREKMYPSENKSPKVCRDMLWSVFWASFSLVMGNHGLFACGCAGENSMPPLRSGTSLPQTQLVAESGWISICSNGCP